MIVATIKWHNFNVARRVLGKEKMIPPSKWVTDDPREEALTTQG